MSPEAATLREQIVTAKAANDTAAVEKLRTQLAVVEGTGTAKTRRATERPVEKPADKTAETPTAAPAGATVSQLRPGKK